MREGWEIKTIGEVCEIRSGRNQKEVENPNGKYPIYGSGGIMGYADDYLCEAGTTIIGRKGSINNPIFVETKFWNVDTAFGFSPKATILPKFLFYFCKGFNFQEMNKGTTIPSLVKTDLLQIRIPVPSLPEQQRIVDILDQEFAKIDALKANAEKSLQAAKDLFQATLKKELEPKDGWKRYCLQDVCTDYGDYGMSLPSKSFDGVRYLRITDITEWGDLNDDKVSVDADEIDERYMVRAGDILFARTGATVGKTLVYEERFGRCCYAGYLIRYRPDQSIVLPRMLYYITHSASYYEWVAISQKSATLPNISAKLYNSYELSLPSTKEQGRIISQLDELNEKCLVLQQNYQKTLALCDDLKQAILHKAFNGEL